MRLSYPNGFRVGPCRIDDASAGSLQDHFRARPRYRLGFVAPGGGGGGLRADGEGIKVGKILNSGVARPECSVYVRCRKIAVAGFLLGACTSALGGVSGSRLERMRQGQALCLAGAFGAWQ